MLSAVPWLPIGNDIAPIDEAVEEGIGTQPEVTVSVAPSRPNLFALQRGADHSAKVMVVKLDSMRHTDDPTGSNPTPHPMPVPWLVDASFKDQLEQRPGMHDSVVEKVMGIQPDSMRPAAKSFRGCIPTDLVSSSQGVIWGQTIGNSLEHGSGMMNIPKVEDEVISPDTKLGISFPDWLGPPGITDGQ